MGCGEFRAHLGTFVENEVRHSLDRPPDRHCFAFGSKQDGKEQTEKTRERH